MNQDIPSTQKLLETKYEPCTSYDLRQRELRTPVNEDSTTDSDSDLRSKSRYYMKNLLLFLILIIFGCLPT